MNQARLEEAGDPEIMTRINAYEMAARMQTSAPELMDLRQESPETLALYGVEPGKPSFANNCLLARRLVERGVRFVQLYHTDWDHHGDQKNNLSEALDQRCREVDHASAALVLDLKARGLLEGHAGHLGRRIWPHADRAKCARPSAAITTSRPTPCGWPAAA